MPRFAILEHDHPVLHWDLMLEDGDRLLTWRLAAFPQAGERVEAVLLADHRLVYLDYEGPISGGRGSVVRRDQGVFEWLDRTSACLMVRLEGKLLKGSATLRSSALPRTSGAGPSEFWSFVLQPETECP